MEARGDLVARGEANVIAIRPVWACVWASVGTGFVFVILSVEHCDSNVPRTYVACVPAYTYQLSSIVLWTSIYPRHGLLL